MHKKDNRYSSSLYKSFVFAFSGIQSMLAERNFRIHLVLAFLAVILGLYLGLTFIEWSIIVLTIAVILAAEAFNSAIENICDRITMEHDISIGKIKDISAAAVLLLAMASLFIAALIFIPKII